jgi:hypothetical protein
MIKMKKISIITIGTVAFIVAIIVGCGKVVLNYGDVQLLDNTQATIKINNESLYANNRSVFYKINDVRVSGLFTARSPFPGGGYNTGGNNTADVLQVPAGTVKLSVVLPHKIDNGTDSVVLYTTTLQLDGGQSYTVHMADTAANTQTLLTKENLTLTDSSYCRMHFVNLMPNVPAIDVYYGTAATTVADQSTDSLFVGNLAFMKNSDDVKFKMNGANRIWKIRTAGSAKTNNVLASYTSTSVPTSQRVFVGFALGYNGKTTTVQKPYISFILIR